MSETPRIPQFVGSADARTLKSSETPQKFDISPEQKQLVDALQKNTEVLERTLLIAREKAGSDLKKLTGKEMVDAGWNQLKRGMVENVKHQAVDLVKGGILGGAAGLLFGQLPGSYVTMSRELPGRLNNLGPRARSTGVGVVGGAALGLAWGTETGWRSYNKVAKQEGLPQTKWFDLVLSNLITANIAVLPQKNPTNPIAIGAKVIAWELFNPNTIGAFRTIGVGLAKMAAGK